MELPIKETQIVNACLDYLHLKGYWAKRFNTVGIFNTKVGCYMLNPNTPKGMSDILCLEKGTGRAIFVECKRKNSRQSPNQIEFESDVIKQGARYFVARSIEDLVKLGF